jgi:hypothetical protein
MPRHESDADALRPGRSSDEPSMSQLLAACAAASAVSTPPKAPEAAADPGNDEHPQGPENGVRRDAA